MLVLKSPRWSNLRLISALASFGCALCFVIGFCMILWIEPGINNDAQTRFRFIIEHGRFFQLWYTIIFVVFGGCLLLLSNTINKQMEVEPNWLSQIAAMAGFVWASYVLVCGLIAIFTIEYLLATPAQQQSPVWAVIYAIQMGLGDGIEWVGGIWLLSLSGYFLMRHVKPRWMHGFGLAVGVCGCLTLIPGFVVMGIVFGLAQIVWFTAIGVVILQQPSWLNSPSQA